jgi:hypothetical protein
LWVRDSRKALSRRKGHGVVAGAPWPSPALYSHWLGSVGIAGEVTVFTVSREGKRAAPPPGGGTERKQGALTTYLENFFEKLFATADIATTENWGSDLTHIREAHKRLAKKISGAHQRGAGTSTPPRRKGQREAQSARPS